MTIKQLGGVFGRHPTFNTVDVDGVLNTSGNVKIGGTTLSNPNSYGNIVNVQGYAPAVVLTESDTGKNYTLGINGQSLRLIEGTTVRTTFDTSGNLTVNTGNLVIGTSGKGIDFSATAGTGTSELFDDYEEGTWTPSLIGATSGSMSFAVTSLNRYTKVGRVVHVVAFLSGGDMGAHTISGNVLVSGLPFTATAVGAGVVSVTYCNLTTADETDLTISGYANGTNIHLLKGSSISAVTNADLLASGTNGAIMLDITYETGA